ncbi:MAG: hypothetical protein ACK468_06610 [Dolichospermum sp.]
MLSVKAGNREQGTGNSVQFFMRDILHLPKPTQKHAFLCKQGTGNRDQGTVLTAGYPQFSKSDKEKCNSF